MMIGGHMNLTFRTAASLASVGFLGGWTRFPFFVCEGFDCLDDEDLLWSPFVFPCTIGSDMLNLGRNASSTTHGNARYTWEFQTRPSAVSGTTEHY